MPDGTTNPGQPPATDPSQTPPNPTDQINLEIAVDRVTAALGGIFGPGWNTPTAGGGGTGGNFMFASIDELNGVIAQWETELESIMTDGTTIREAAANIREPAPDGMSVGHATASRRSLLRLLEHNTAMREYAAEYVSKLKDSRTSMVNNDVNGQTRMNRVDRG